MSAARSLHRHLRGLTELLVQVAVLIPHDGDDHAVRLANDSVYGLGGSVFSADADRARSVASRMRTGSVTINAWATNQLGPRDPTRGEHPVQHRPVGYLAQQPQPRQRRRSLLLVFLP